MDKVFRFEQIPEFLKSELPNTIVHSDDQTVVVHKPINPKYIGHTCVRITLSNRYKDQDTISVEGMVVVPKDIGKIKEVLDVLDELNVSHVVQESFDANRVYIFRVWGAVSELLPLIVRIFVCGV